MSGFVQRFKGKIKAYVLWLGEGGIVESLSGIAGKMRVAQRLAIAVTAIADTDFTMSIPPGATIVGMTAFTTTAFTASTDAKIEVGASAGDNSYVALTSIKSAGMLALTLASATPAVMGATLPNLFLRLVQTGTATAVGAATVVVEYIMP